MRGPTASSLINTIREISEMDAFIALGSINNGQRLFRLSTTRLVCGIDRSVRSSRPRNDVTIGIIAKEAALVCLLQKELKSRTILVAVGARKRVKCDYRPG